MPCLLERLVALSSRKSRVLFQAEALLGAVLELPPEAGTSGVGSEEKPFRQVDSGSEPHYWHALGLRVSITVQ